MVGFSPSPPQALSRSVSHDFEVDAMANEQEATTIVLPPKLHYLHSTAGKLPPVSTTACSSNNTLEVFLEQYDIEEAHLKELTLLRNHISRLTSQLATSKARVEFLEHLLTEEVAEYENGDDVHLLVKLGIKTTVGLLVFSLLRRRISSPSGVLVALLAVFGLVKV